MNTEATRSGLLRALKVWLPHAVQPDKQTFMYFMRVTAWHLMTENLHIVPYSADAFLLEDTAISRERFYEESAAKPRQLSLDNCYAGTTRSEERLLAQS